MVRRKISSARRTDSRIENTVDVDAGKDDNQKESAILEAQTLEAQPIENLNDAPTIDDFDDVAHFEIPVETPKKRGRKKGSTNKRKAQPPTAQTADFALALIDIIGISLAGDEGTLNDTERTLLTLSLNEVTTRYSEQVEKYVGYVYPVCGVLALGLWGKRIITLRGENKHEQATNEQTGQQSNNAQTAATGATGQSNIFNDPILSNGVNRPF